MSGAVVGGGERVTSSSDYWPTKDEEKKENTDRSGVSWDGRFLREALRELLETEIVSHDVKYPNASAVSGTSRESLKLSPARPLPDA
jgi:hypothetical protein